MKKKIKILKKKKKNFKQLLGKLHPIIGKYWKYFNDLIKQFFTHFLGTRVNIRIPYGQT
jgi:hypothetical protein